MRNANKRPFLLVFYTLVFTSCIALRHQAVKRKIEKLPEQSEVISNYFLGVSIYDPETREYLIDVNADKYFTPASNTKILSLATWLSLQLDSIPSYIFSEIDNNFYLQPLADPTFLHPDFPFQKAFDFVEDISYDSLFILSIPDDLEVYGSGWAWDDYNYAFQPERSIMPVYGNTLTVDQRGDWVKYTPDFFESFIDDDGEFASRSRDYNWFQIPLDKYKHREMRIPFKTDQELIRKLIEDTVGRPTTLMQGPLPEGDIFYGYDRLPVLMQMMLNSDNFLAEQLLLNAQLYEGYSDTKSYIEYKKRTLFKDSPQAMEWVDGSGLSRYNMVTPMSLVSVLEIVYRQLSWNEISLIFPKGGVSGTIKNWYAGDEPYIFAKTGTLRHNHCLSGFMVTKSGRRLIFSIMNNHYTNGTTEVKQEMQKILESVRDAY
jgi:D-alanyl-D-alanine carboxypeptidase/D-alanyl-D-alanine-endopeptidase (penicillin-binding protein 4)